jgi:hypothetical protein
MITLNCIPSLVSDFFNTPDIFSTQEVYTYLDLIFFNIFFLIYVNNTYYSKLQQVIFLIEKKMFRNSIKIQITI